MNKVICECCGATIGNDECSYRLHELNCVCQECVEENYTDTNEYDEVISDLRDDIKTYTLDELRN